MKVYERTVRFDEVDAARIVFFGRYMSFCHEAMEDFFSELDGGYPHLIVRRGVGVPAVDVRAKYFAPVRYGDVLRIETSTAKLGGRSAVLRYRLFRLPERTLAAEVEHTVVTTDLAAMKSIEMPPDVRAVFSRHLEPEAAT